MSVRVAGCRSSVALGLLMALLVGVAAHPVHAQAAPGRTPAGRTAEDVVLPYVPLPADLHMAGNRVQSWRSGGTHHVLLEGDAEVAVDDYGFKADKAVVFITPVPGPGSIYQLEIYLDALRELGGYGPITAEAPRLLVTAMIRGKVHLEADRLVKDQADGHRLVQAATARVARYYRALEENIVAAGDLPRVYPRDVYVERARRQAALRNVEPMAVPDTPAYQDGRLVQRPPIRPVEPGDDTGEDPAPRGQRQAALPTGRVFFRADQVVYQEGDKQSHALLVGDVTVMYADPGRRMNLTLTADRAVLFAEPGVLRGNTQANAQTVRGVYLEDDVLITNGQYTLRGPRMFYDLTSDRALVLDAVFYTWDIRRKLPLYVRARKLLQVSQQQWRAEQAVFSTSAFAEPHLALGVDRLTVRQVEADDEAPTYTFTAEDTTVRAGDLPVFYWPKVAGEMAELPIRSARLDYDSDDGVILKTRWDLFALAGRGEPDGVDASLLIDAYTSRAGAIGLDVAYERPVTFGRTWLYGMYDVGEDNPGGRDEVEPEDELRGLVHLQHRHYLLDDWQVSAEISYLSDPTLLEEFFPEHAYTDRPWETSLYAKKQVAEAAFPFELQYDLLDFVPQLARLQTPGYTVDKLPEIAYHRIGTSLFDDTVTWFSENRASVLQLNLPEITPDEIGFSEAEAMALFGIMNTAGFHEAARFDGLDEDVVYRADSRQELQAPLKWGPIDVVPYAAGRITAYDEDFGREDENVRLWAAGGVKLHTAFSRDYNVQSELLDIHRLRHIIEPSLHAGWAWTNLEQQDLPVYTYDVESIADGGYLRVGVRNTLVTQRGGPGAWQDVEVLRVDTDFVFGDDDDDEAMTWPIPRFFDYRPEYSLAGDHFWGEVAWQITDAIATVANVTYSFESDRIENWNYGIVYDHTPSVSIFGQVRSIEALDSLVVRYGLDYLLSVKYHLTLAHTIDVEDDEANTISAVLTRRLPQSLLGLAISYDAIDDSTTVGISFVPLGIGGDDDDNPFVHGP